MRHRATYVVIGVLVGTIAMQSATPAAESQVDVPDRHGANWRPKVIADDGQGSGGGGEVRTFSLPNGATMEFVWMEPGTFTMGSPSSESGRGSDEGPQHEVAIREGFWLGRYEITQEQWEAVMGTAPWSGQSYVQANASNPAVYISWDDVDDLIGLLNTDADATVYRLPMEAEWEYACRAGTSTRWSFGDEKSQLGEYAWYDDNAWNAGLQYAQPVGTKLPNPWGLFDMHGNVWEWCQDSYGSYPSAAEVDPQGPSAGSSRVIRGGNFYFVAPYTRSAYRYSYAPGRRSNAVGARLLRRH